MVTEDRPTGYCGITRRCIEEYYNMGRTRGIALEVLVDGFNGTNLGTRGNMRMEYL